MMDFLKALSKGELQSVKKAVGLENLINKNSKDYKKLNMDKIRGAAGRTNAQDWHRSGFRPNPAHASRGKRRT